MSIYSEVRDSYGRAPNYVKTFSKGTIVALGVVGVGLGLSAGLDVAGDAVAGHIVLNAAEEIGGTVIPIGAALVAIGQYASTFTRE